MAAEPKSPHAMDAMTVLQPAIIGTYEVFLEDLSFDFTIGTSQRQVDQNFVEELVQSFKHRGVLNKDWRHYIVLLADGDKVKEFEKQSRQKEGALPPQLRDGSVLVGEKAPILRGLRKAMNTTLEVQAGQHRIKALEKLRREELSGLLEGEDLEEAIMDKVSWVGIVLDLRLLTATRLCALELIRLNPEEVKVPDTEGDIWNKWRVLDEIERKATAEERTDLQRNHQIIRNASVGGKVTQRFSRLWASPHLRPLVTRLLRFPFYHATFKSIHWEGVMFQRRILWFYDDFFELLEGLLNEAFGGCPEALDEISFQEIAAIPDRTPEVMQTLFYPAGVRNPRILKKMTDEEFAIACKALSDNRLVKLSDFRELGHMHKGIGSVLQDLMFHVCRWICMGCFNEGQSTRVKTSAEAVWLSEIHRRRRYGIIPTFTGGTAADGNNVAANEVKALGREIVRIVKEREQDFNCAQEMSPSALDETEYHVRFQKPGWAKLGALMIDKFGSLDHPSVKTLGKDYFDKRIVVKSSTQENQRKRKAATKDTTTKDATQETSHVSPKTKGQAAKGKASPAKSVGADQADTNKNEAQQEAGAAKETAPEKENPLHMIVVASINAFNRHTIGRLANITTKDYTQLEEDLMVMYMEFIQKIHTKFVRKAKKGHGGPELEVLYPKGVSDLETALEKIQDLVNECGELFADSEDEEVEEVEEQPSKKRKSQITEKPHRKNQGQKKKAGGAEAKDKVKESRMPVGERKEENGSSAGGGKEQSESMKTPVLEKDPVGGSTGGTRAEEGVGVEKSGLTYPLTQVSHEDVERERRRNETAMVEVAAQIANSSLGSPSEAEGALSKQSEGVDADLQEDGNAQENQGKGALVEKGSVEPSSSGVGYGGDFGGSIIQVEDDDDDEPYELPVRKVVDKQIEAPTRKVTRSASRDPRKTPEIAPSISTHTQKTALPEKKKGPRPATKSQQQTRAKAAITQVEATQPDIRKKRRPNLPAEPASSFKELREKVATSSQPSVTRINRISVGRPGEEASDTEPDEGAFGGDAMDVDV
ncbi:hypothetical protein DFH27DRAFT_91420 [Peziza echinospora]|nr:hypothetical protein DFH27DRAFT_91420 [Peziza echinospora]